MVLGLCAVVSGCGQETYCCALDKVSTDTRFDRTYRDKLGKVAEAQDEDACQTVVEADYELLEDYFLECAGE